MSVQVAENATGNAVPRRNIRPRPIDVDLAMPVLHIKDEDHSSDDDVTTTTTTTTTLTTTITTTTTTKGRGRPKKIKPEVTATFTASASFSTGEDQCCSCHEVRAEEMVYCDGCPRAFHLQCADPPLKKVPKGSWLCNNKHDEIYYQSKQWKNTDDIAAPTTDPEQLKEVLIPELRHVEDYEDSNEPNFSRPNSYIIFQEKSLEQQEKNVDYELDSDDEQLLSSLADDLDEDTFESIIFTLELDAYKRKRLAPTLFAPFAPLLPVTVPATQGISTDQFFVTTPPMTTAPTPAVDSPSSAISEPNSSVPISASNSLADLNLNPTFNADDVTCCVCGDGESDDFNVIVLCDGCDMAVHQLCYGIQHIPQGEWHCSICTAGIHEATCGICSQIGGGMKPTTDGKWAHLVCAIWSPEVSIKDAVLMEPIDGVEKIGRERASLICSICNTPGACIQCKDESCVEAYHAFCALRAKYHMEILLGNDHSVVFETFCEMHSDSRMSNTTAMSKTTGSWTELDAPVELKTTCTAQAPLIRKRFNISPSTVEAICKHWLIKRKKSTQPLIRSLQEYKDAFSIELEKKKNARLPMIMKANTTEDYNTLKLIRQGMERTKILVDVAKHQLETKEALPEGTAYSLYPELKKQFSMFEIEEDADIFDVSPTKQKSKKKKTGRPSEKESRKRKEEDFEYLPEVSRGHYKTETSLPSQPGQGEVFNLHCHHCKKRRPRCAICPYNTTHRYCQNCVNRHFSVDYEALAENPLNFWKSGCPKCLGACPCAVCRNAALAATAKKEEMGGEDSDYSSKKDKRKSTSPVPKRQPKKKAHILLEDDEEANPSSSPELPEVPTPKVSTPATKPAAPSPQTESLQTGPESTSPSSAAKRGRGRPPKKPKTSVPPPGEVNQQHNLEPLFDMIHFNTEPLFTGGLDSMPPVFYPAENINCQICMRGDDEEKLILCDKCDKGFHIYCLNIPLDQVPQGTWYCDTCAENSSAPAIHLASVSLPVAKAPKRGRPRIHM